MVAADQDDTLHDFAVRALRLLDIDKRVYVAGRGPAVIVMTEMPGISPHVARFARWLRDAGFTVHLPSLFGRDGAWPQAEEGLGILRRACVSAEFRALAANASSPVTQWLRALAREAHRECGGLGVGAVGMCFTGNFALTMMLEPAVRAPVLSQPSLPLDDPAGIESGAEELAAIRARLERDDLSVLAYRFDGDEAEIDLAAHHQVEFDAWRWGYLEETPQLIVPFKRPAYDAVAQAFAPFAARP